MQALLRRYRQSPRKVRLVARAIRGCSVAEAKVRLRQLTKRAGGPLEKLLQSAFTNARRQSPNVGEADLLISGIAVDKGPVLKRFRPRARGSAAAVHKHTSHITVKLTAKSQQS